MSDLKMYNDQLDALIANLSPASRRNMAAEIAKKLRATQQQNIKAQHGPDGKPFVARKKLPTRGKKGRIKRAMFTKLRTARYLKAKGTSNEATVEFTGNVQRMARVHHYGLRDRPSKKTGGTDVRYEKRPLLGVNKKEKESIEKIYLEFLS